MELKGIEQAQKIQFQPQQPASSPNYDSDSQFDYELYLQSQVPVYESKLISPLMKKKKKDILSATRI